jgi:predicted DsbA family dithiol-disulfide isomerase
MNAIKIDLYTDVICPWCLIGEHRLDQTIDRHFSHLSVDIEHHPVQLIPDTPALGLRFSDLMKSRGLDPDTVQRRPQAEALALGLKLDLSRQPNIFPTLKAHTLIRVARPLGIQHSLAVALATAYFIGGRNISETSVLAEIAVEHGFDKTDAERSVESPVELEVTRAQAREASDQGIRGVPHFVFNGDVTLTGHHPESAFVAAITEARQRVRTVN